MYFSLKEIITEVKENRDCKSATLKPNEDKGNKNREVDIN